jgi:hypothetical protein
VAHLAVLRLRVGAGELVREGHGVGSFPLAWTGQSPEIQNSLDPLGPGCPLP